MFNTFTLLPLDYKSTAYRLVNEPSIKEMDQGLDSDEQIN